MAAYTAIDDPEAYFQITIRDGTGAENVITFGGTTSMQPDMVWTKARDEADGHHAIHDSVRGVSQWLRPNLNIAEESPISDALTAYGSDGYTMGADAVGYDFNEDDDTYVDWCWKAGTTSGISTNAATDITPSGYSFSQDAGFSIIEYTGNTDATTQLPHGLGAVPHYIMVKNVSHADNWYVYHHKLTAAPETDYLHTNLTNATYDADGIWGDTAPDSVNITLGTDPGVNDSGRQNMAYVWTGKQGYSKFGTYEGNGNADGTFVYTGFRPAFVMTKSFDSTSDWHMFDNKREGYNPDNDPLEGNDGAVEATTDMIDILSNGFKCRIATDPNVAETYIYVAFAEAPFVNSNGVPCNAR